MTERPRLNLALQGGGAHGAFTWGVLDALLADGRVDLDGICGTSAGAMNAAVLASGYLRGGREGAREALHDFWHAVSCLGMFGGAGLLREFRAMAFVSRLIDEGWLKEEYRGRLRRMYIHAVRADSALADFGVASKFNLAWPFLTTLRDRGRATAAGWLERHADAIGRRSTVDLHAEFIDPHTRGWELEESFARPSDLYPLEAVS
ncbi:MAG: hypothetical protein HGA45_42655 [Chloroflexales bacterium]|nr:hypothetical protein [Chloroflexales bacterium]